MLCTQPAPAFTELTNALLPDRQLKTDRLQQLFVSGALATVIPGAVFVLNTVPSPLSVLLFVTYVIISEVLCRSKAQADLYFHLSSLSQLNGGKTRSHRSIREAVLGQTGHPSNPMPCV